MHVYKDKSVKGTPDSIKKFPDGSIYAFQYTTTESDLRDKILQDIDGVHDWEFAQNVRRVIICCNSRINDEIKKECEEKCFRYGWELDLIDVDLMLSIILGSYDARVKVSKYFQLDTCSINLQKDLENYTMHKYPSLAGSEIKDNYHQKLLKFDIFALKLKAVSTLDGTELDLKTNQNIILTGEAGAGKSTYIKRWFLKCLEEIDFQYIPVFCELKSYSGESLSEYVKLNFEKSYVQINADLINRLLLEGRFKLFLD